MQPVDINLKALYKALAAYRAERTVRNLGALRLARARHATSVKASERVTKESHFKSVKGR